MAGDKDQAAAANQQTFSFETMAVVLYAMQKSGVTLGTKHFEMMAAISGKGKDSFNHQFRKVKARAKELGEQAKDGTLPAAASTPTKKGGAPGSGKKRSKLTDVPSQSDQLLTGSQIARRRRTRRTMRRRAARPRRSRRRRRRMELMTRTWTRHEELVSSQRTIS